MRKIYELMGFNKNDYKKGLYGVEIEIEGKRLPTFDISPIIWKVEKDGSLKALEAWEYVMPVPDSIDGVKNSIHYLNTKFKENKSEIYESIRAGVHVHMNVNEWNIRQVMTFSILYYLFEDIMLNFCGPNREGNLFSLRLRDAEYPIFRLLKVFQNKDLQYLNQDIIRYASLNYYSLFKYGSLEFRGMRSTKDLDKIVNWVEIIDDLRNSSLKFETPNEVMSDMSGSGELEFIKYIFPNTHHHFNLSDELIKSVRENARRVQILVYSVDWEEMENNSVNPFELGW